jgi:hypothetical protein
MSSTTHQVLPGGSGATPTKGPECRVFKRVDCELPTSCAPTASGELRWSATIRDISVSGLRLSLRRRFERNAALAIELPGTPGQEPYVVFVKVMNTRAEDGGTWSLGCQFVSELGEDELERLLTAFPQHAEPVAQPPAQTLAPDTRVIANAMIRLEIVPGRFIRGRVKWLRAPEAWPPAAGTAMKFHGQASNGSQWHHRIEIVKCSRYAESWRVDARVVDE